MTARATVRAERATKWVHTRAMRVIATRMMVTTRVTMVAAITANGNKDSTRVHYDQLR